MAMTYEEKIAAAELRLKQLKAAKQKAEARAKMAKNKVVRAMDTRRKILAGAVILERMARGEFDGFKEALNHDLMRENDRALFGLEPKI